MTQLTNILPQRTDRAVLIGQTGSGKTTLARALLATRTYVVVLDTKGMLKWPEFTKVTSTDQLAQLDPKKTQKIHFVPPYAWTQDSAQVDGFFRWIYDRRNTTLYIDELASITQGDQYPFHFGACFMRGRELEIEVFAGTQRPTRIPQVVLSESEAAYCFKLRLPQDRQRVEAIAGIPQERIAALAKHEFLYSYQSGDVLGPYKLAPYTIAA